MIAVPNSLSGPQLADLPAVAAVPRRSWTRREKERGMDRYGGDFNRRPMMRYGGEYQQWGGMPRYDRDFGYRGDRTGRFYERDFSGYETRNFRPSPRYDRGYTGRGY